MIDAHAGQGHFVDHLAPIWELLPERGRFTVSSGVIAKHALRRGVKVELGRPRLRYPVMVAGAGDFQKRAQMVLVEHGAGQTYPGRVRSYPGGSGRDDIRLFVCPNEKVAALNRKWYPKAEYAVVGCPKMDRWLVRGAWERGEPATVALSFHWRQAGSAWAHYARAFGALVAAAPFRVIGHAHPRIAERYRFRFRKAGIEFVPDFEEVLARADLYVCDNSSTIFEFALTGRPVVLLDAPTQPKRGSLPLRFGEAWDVGLHATNPRDWLGVMEAALLDPPEVRAKREAIIEGVYAYRDGTSSQRAADAISAWLSSGRKEAAA